MHAMSRHSEVCSSGCGEPAARDAAEFFQGFPQEAAIVLQRSVELSAIFSCLLGMHCTVLAFNSMVAGASNPDGFDIDEVLQGLCLVRIICMAPRPYWWIRERAQFVRARRLPTPQELARRLVEIHSQSRGAMEEGLRKLYCGWLACATLVVCLARLAPEPTALTEHMWRHLLINFSSMVMHRISCMLLFLYLSRSDIRRGVSPHALDAHTTRGTVTGQVQVGAQVGGHSGSECSICLCEYVCGEEVRTLSCGHCFHRNCLDPWLLNHRNRCPLCLEIVGLAAPKQSARP